MCSGWGSVVQLMNPVDASRILSELVAQPSAAIQSQWTAGDTLGRLHGQVTPDVILHANLDVLCRRDSDGDSTAEQGLSELWIKSEDPRFSCFDHLFQPFSLMRGSRT